MEKECVPVADLVYVVVTIAAVRDPRPGRAGGGTAVNVENLVGLVLAVVLTVFLVVALLFPERF